MKLKKRTVLITGGTSGIGLELAKQLQQQGNTVIVTGRYQAKLDATRRLLPGVHTFKSDVSDPAAIAVLHDSVIAQFPKLDTLVNNAGIMRNLCLNRDRDLVDVTQEIEMRACARGAAVSATSQNARACVDHQRLIRPCLHTLAHFTSLFRHEGGDPFVHAIVAYAARWQLRDRG